MFKLKAAFGGLMALVCLSGAAHAQIANGKSKWLGNVTGNSVPSNFNTYWNQITPENASKWGSVEGTRNQMNWSGVDAAYNHAQQNGYPFKFHTFVWGAQFPGWITSLSQSEQRAEIEQWMQAACTRYPNIWGVDVVNEPIKTSMPFKAALGGDGATGWDWVITAFQLARQYCPNAKLLLNEYGTENDPPVRNTYKNILNLLKARGLIDGIGIQAHYFNIDNMNGSAVTTMLNDYATLALDIYVSELDIVANGTDAGQLAKYQDVFPAFWNHASVKGVTLWGYIVGQTWRDGTGLVQQSGAERPAMQWLETFVAGSGPGDTQAPTAPSNLASPSRTSSSISLTWTASTDNVGVTAYQVLRAPGASGGSFAQVGTSSSTSFTDSGLAANTTFRYQVRAVDAAGNASAVSGTVTQTTLTAPSDTQAPTTPAGLASPSQTSSSISLTWSASTDNVGVTGYQILRAPGASGGSFAQVGTSTGTSFTNSGLAASTTFRFQVRAVDAAGNVSAVSNTVTAATSAGNPNPTGPCSAVATVQTQWGEGYVIEPVRVTNTGTSTINGWTVTFTLPSGHTMPNGGWNGVFTVSGQTVTVRNASYNGTLQPNGSTTFGFQVRRPNGNTSLPSGYTCASP
jgi:endo-1,4-beta-xylanase